MVTWHQKAWCVPQAFGRTQLQASGGGGGGLTVRGPCSGRNRVPYFQVKYSTKHSPSIGRKKSRVFIYLCFGRFAQKRCLPKTSEKLGEKMDQPNGLGNGCQECWESRVTSRSRAKQMLHRLVRRERVCKSTKRPRALAPPLASRFESFGQTPLVG